MMPSMPVQSIKFAPSRFDDNNQNIFFPFEISQVLAGYALRSIFFFPAWRALGS